MGLCHAQQLVTQIVACTANGRYLRVLGEGIVNLAIPGAYLAFYSSDVEKLFACQLVHAPDEIRQAMLDDEIGSPLHKGAHRGRRTAASSRRENFAPTTAREIGVLLGARQRELARNDLLAQYEPGIVVACGHEMGERAQRVEAGE